MIQIPLGDKFIEVDDDKKIDLEDLANSPSNVTLLGILNDQCFEKAKEMRTYVESGDLGKAQESNGYIKALEDLSRLLSEGLGQSVRD